MDISASLSAQLVRNTRTQQTPPPCTETCSHRWHSPALCVPRFGFSVHIFVNLPDTGPRLRPQGGRRDTEEAHVAGQGDGGCLCRKCMDVTIL